jgi:hypothetical protein
MPRAHYPRGNSPQYPLNRLGEAQCRSGLDGEEKNFHSPSLQSIAYSLFRLKCYTYLTFKDDLQLVCKYLKGTDTAPVFRDHMFLVPRATSKLEEVNARIRRPVHRSQQ